jgi:hypothetical protein
VAAGKKPRLPARTYPYIVDVFSPHISAEPGRWFRMGKMALWRLYVCSYEITAQSTPSQEHKVISWIGQQHPGCWLVIEGEARFPELTQGGNP